MRHSTSCSWPPESVEGPAVWHCICFWTEFCAKGRSQFDTTFVGNLSEIVADGQLQAWEGGRSSQAAAAERNPRKRSHNVGKLASFHWEMFESCEFGHDPVPRSLSIKKLYCVHVFLWIWSIDLLIGLVWLVWLSVIWSDLTRPVNSLDLNNLPWSEKVPRKN